MSEVESLKAHNAELRESIARLKADMESASVIRPVKDDSETIARLQAEIASLKADINGLLKLLEERDTPRLERLRPIDYETKAVNVASKLKI